MILSSYSKKITVFYFKKNRYGFCTLWFLLLLMTQRKMGNDSGHDILKEGGGMRAFLASLL